MWSLVYMHYLAVFIYGGIRSPIHGPKPTEWHEQRQEEVQIEQKHFESGLLRVFNAQKVESGETKGRKEEKSPNEGTTCRYKAGEQELVCGVVFQFWVDVVAVFVCGWVCAHYLTGDLVQELVGRVCEITEGVLEVKVEEFRVTQLN